MSCHALRTLSHHDESLSEGPFAKPEWLRETCRWIAQQIEPLKIRLTGNFRQLSASSSFRLMRYETTVPAVWFKAVGKPNSHEFNIVSLLTTLLPEYLPRIRRAPRDPDSAKRWLTFLRNHREAIAAMDFFTVATLSFGVLYCFFVIGHDRRTILHFNVTRNPNALWVVQQLREAWVYKQPHRFLLFDRDAKFGADVVSAVRDMES